MAATSSRRQRLNALLSRPYRVLLVPGAHGVTAHVLGLNLVASGKTERHALDALDAEKRRFFERYIAAGEPAPLPDPVQQPNPSGGNDFKSRALAGVTTTLIVVATLVVLTLIAIPFVDAIGARIVLRARESIGYYMDTRQRAWDAMTPDERRQAIACVSGRDPKLLTDALALLMAMPGCASPPANPAPSRQ